MVWKEVAVLVERLGRGLVPEHVLNDLDVGTHRDRDARGGVPQSVGDEIRVTKICCGVREGGFLKPLGTHRPAVADAGEREVVWPLTGHVSKQLVDERPGYRHLPSLMTL